MAAMGSRHFQMRLAVLVPAVVLCSRMICSAEASDCSFAPKDLVSWWAAEANAGDDLRRNPGVLQGKIGFAPGKVNSAFSVPSPWSSGYFEAGYFEVPDSPSLNPLSSFTLEAWIYDMSSSWRATLIEKGVQYRLGLAPSNLGRPVLATSIETDRGSFSLTGTNCLRRESWTHIAVTYDGSSLVLYVDGNIDGATQATGSVVSTSSPIIIGNRGESGFVGRIDEITLYSRALSPAEILEIYRAGSNGKCPVEVPPVLLTSPSDQIVSEWVPATLRAKARGSLPLAYQWELNGVPIPNATNTDLHLESVSSQNAGVYTIQVENAFGTASSSASITVSTNLVSALELTAGTNWILVPLEPTNAPYSYQWKFNGTNLPSGSDPSLVLMNVQSANAGEYALVQTNAADSVTSHVYRVSIVDSAPVIYEQPASILFKQGSDIVLRCLHFGTSPTAHQWWKDDGPVAAGTNQLLRIEKAAPEDAGSYWVVVSNDLGSAPVTGR